MAKETTALSPATKIHCKLGDIIFSGEAGVIQHNNNNNNHYVVYLAETVGAQLNSVLGTKVFYLL